MTGDQRSYRPDRHGGGFDGAVDRLEAQARLTWPAERGLLAATPLASDAVVVEIGCGSGALLTRIGELFPGRRLVGVDHDGALLARAADAAPAAELLVADAAAVPLPDASADLVVMRYVLQHLADPVTALREAHRLLRPGGHCVAFEVDGGLWGISHPHLPEMEALQARIWAAQTTRGGDRMIGRRLRGLAAAAGFEQPGLDLYHYSSDDVPLAEFGPLLDPEQYVDLVEDGVLSPMDVARAAAAYRRWLADPDSYLMMVGFALTGVR